MGSSSDGQTLLILGASGDLTARLLLPGLGGLLASGGAGNFQLVGSAVEDWDDDRWRARIAGSFAAADASGQEVDAVVDNARYSQADVTDAADLRAVLDACRGAVIAYSHFRPRSARRHATC